MDAYWTAEALRIRASNSFQYMPHTHITPLTVRSMLTVLSRFEGVDWSEKTVMRALAAAGHTAAAGAGGRMLRKSLENYGLLWFEQRSLWITPSGQAIIDGSDPGQIMERLLWKYQLDNPINGGATGFRLYPHRALLRTLLAVDGELSRDEFALFAGRTRSEADVGGTTIKINAWRSLSRTQQDEVLTSVDGGRFFTKQLRDTGYVLGFHNAARYLDRWTDARGRVGIRLLRAHRAEITDRLNELGSYDPIPFTSKPECVAVYGDPEQSADGMDEVDRLLDSSKYTEAVAAFSRLPATARNGRSVAEFQAAVFLERDLEDYLTRNINAIEPGLRLVPGGRQFGTAVGTIDLLALSATGEKVVIELKKDRASDKVFGQLCRYMGCVGAHHVAPGQPVRGYIIGSEIDQKLRYAAKVVPAGVVQLKRFIRDPVSPEIFIAD